MKIVQTNGIQFSVANFSELDSDLRMDAEFFISNLLDQFENDTGNEISEFIQYGTSDSLNEDGLGFPTLRLNELEGLFISKPAKFCNSLTIEQFQELRLLKDDVVIIRTNGNPNLVGRAAIVLENTDFVFASYLFRVKTKSEKINPHTLVVYLESKYGRSEIDRHSMTGNQTNFSPYRFKKIYIPKFSLTFQERIKSLIIDSYHRKIKSDILTNEAQTSFLDLIGGWTPSQDTFKIKETSYQETTPYAIGTSGEIFRNNRMDGSFWLPQFALAESKLRNKGQFEFLCDLSFIRKGVQARRNCETGVLYASIKDCGNLTVSTTEYSDSISTILIDPLDLVFAITGATIGKAAINVSNENIAISGDLLKISPLSISPYYLLTVLSSPLMQELATRYTTGATNGHLSPKDVGKFPIPRLGEHEKKISDKMQEVFEKRNQSQRLIEIAIKAVEVYLEEDENNALEFIDKSIRCI